MRARGRFKSRDSPVGPRPSDARPTSCWRGEPHGAGGGHHGNRVACVRARAHEPPNARANASLSREDRGDMRRALGRGRIETQHTWFIQLSWRSMWLHPSS